MRSAIDWLYHRPAEWSRRIRQVRDNYRDVCGGRSPRIFAPKRFSEKMQWRKLFDGTPVYARLCDKLETRAFISEAGLGARLVPLLWQGERAEDIPFDEIPLPFILKSTNGSNRYRIMRDRAFDRDSMLTEARRWLTTSYGDQLGEPGYIAVPPRLMAEELLQNADGTSPVEYCFFMFDGVVRFIEIYGYDSDRNRSIRFFTPDWVPLDWRLISPLIDPPPPPPADLADMMATAETLGRDFDHVRIDFLVRDEIYFLGEITLYTYSGFFDFQQPDADMEFGRHWVIRRPMARGIWSILSHAWGDGVRTGRAAPAR